MTPGRRRGATLLALGCYILASAACGGDSPTALFIRFLSARSISSQAEALQVTFLTESGEQLAQMTHALAPLTAFPATLEVIQGDATPAQIRVRAFLLVADNVVAAGEARLAFVPGDRIEADIALVDLPWVRSASWASTGGANQLVIERPTALAEGDLMVAVAAHDGGVQFGLSAPAEWTPVPNVTTDVAAGARTYVFWRVAGATEPASFTFTRTPSDPQDMVGGIWAVAGADRAGPIHMSSALAEELGLPTCIAPSITSSVSSTLLLYACAKNNTETSFTPPPGMSESWDLISPGTNKMSFEGAYGIHPAIGATGDLSSTSTAGPSVGLALAVTPAPPCAAECAP